MTAKGATEPTIFYGEAERVDGWWGIRVVASALERPLYTQTRQLIDAWDMVRDMLQLKLGRDLHDNEMIYITVARDCSRRACLNRRSS